MKITLLAALLLSLSFGVQAKKRDESKTAMTYDGPVVEKPAKAHKSAGCGSHGGPGYRKQDGNCASWQDAQTGKK